MHSGALKLQDFAWLKTAYVFLGADTLKLLQRPVQESRQLSSISIRDSEGHSTPSPHPTPPFHQQFSAGHCFLFISSQNTKVSFMKLSNFIPECPLCKTAAGKQLPSWRAGLSSLVRFVLSAGPGTTKCILQSVLPVSGGCLTWGLERCVRETEKLRTLGAMASRMETYEGGKNREDWEREREGMYLLVWLRVWVFVCLWLQDEMLGD